MKITSVEFIKSATKPEHYPTDKVPEILLVGRSNVGKSSFINSVLHRKNIAHISSKPGKTQTLNFFLINEQFRFVDVPGYGYAKVSKTDREAFGVMIELYLQTRSQLELVIQLVDFRHPPTEDDKVMLDYLLSYDIPTIVVGTKMDKVAKNKRLKQEKMIVNELGINAEMFLPYSAETKDNIDVVHDILTQVLEGQS